MIFVSSHSADLVEFADMQQQKPLKNRVILKLVMW